MLLQAFYAIKELIGGTCRIGGILNCEGGARDLQSPLNASEYVCWVERGMNGARERHLVLDTRWVRGAHCKYDCDVNEKERIKSNLPRCIISPVCQLADVCRTVSYFTELQYIHLTTLKHHRNATTRSH